MNDVSGIPQYPWDEGDTVFASALNAAIANTQGTSAVFVSDTPPAAGPGTLWWDSAGTGLYVRYNDGNSTQWVVAQNQNTGGEGAVINVLDHGAKGDGTTDDTAAIQGVLNAYAGKATVFIPNTGQPYIVTGLSVLSNTELDLSGTLLMKPSVSIGGLGLVNVSNQTNIIIRGNGVIDGNTATGAHSAGLSADTVTNLRVSGVTIQNAHYWNINITRSSNVVVNGVTFHGGGNSNEFANGCDSCWFVNCIVDAPTTDLGFGFYGGITNSGMIGNIVRGGAAGIFVLSDSGQPALCSNILIANNICYNNFASGIDIDTSVAGTHSNVVVSNNRIYNNNTGAPGASAEIWIGSVTNGVVTGNLVSATATNSAWGIGINSGSSQINVVGNAIFDIGSTTQPGTGLYVNSAALVEASGNTFRGPAHMTSSIGGTAGTGNSFSGNFSGAPPVTITPHADTVVTSVGNSFFSVQTGSLALISMMELQNAALSARWFMGNVGNTEPGSGDGGSDFGIYNCHDNGNTTGNVPLGIKRSSGVVTLAVAPIIATLPTNAANDAAAATAGVPVGGVYRNGSVMMVRVA